MAFATLWSLYHFDTMPFGLQGVAATIRGYWTASWGLARALWLHTLMMWSSTVPPGGSTCSICSGCSEQSKMLGSECPEMCPGKKGTPVHEACCRRRAGTASAVKSGSTAAPECSYNKKTSVPNYSRFIPHYATLIVPIWDLLTKGIKEPVPWGPECHGQDLSGSPVFQDLDFSCPLCPQ